MSSLEYKVELPTKESFSGTLQTDIGFICEEPTFKEVDYHKNDCGKTVHDTYTCISIELASGVIHKLDVIGKLNLEKGDMISICSKPKGKRPGHPRVLKTLFFYIHKTKEMRYVNPNCKRDFYSEEAGVKLSNISKSAQGHESAAGKIIMPLGIFCIFLIVFRGVSIASAGGAFALISLVLFFKLDTWLWKRNESVYGTYCRTMAEVTEQVRSRFKEIDSQLTTPKG